MALQNPLAQVNFPKRTLNVKTLVVLMCLMVSVAITSCQQDNGYNRLEGPPSVLPIEDSVTIQQPFIESPKPTSPRIVHPTPTISYKKVTQPTVTPYPTSTPYPKPQPLLDSTPPHALSTPLTATPVPTPERPKVSGYLLIINGTYVLPNEVSIQVDNGHVMVHPMTDEDGSYPIRTEVTLGYYPDNATDVALWSGVDGLEGSIAKVIMDRDREVFATIGP